MTERSNVTRLLQKWTDGDAAALDRLVPLLYEELRGLAHARMRGERTGHSLATTDLVHEAFLRLVDLDRMEWRDRRHFLAMASRVMRRVLIDHARRASAEKRGGDREKIALDDVPLMTDSEIDSLLILDQMLERLEAEHPRAAGVLEQRYFGGFTSEEIADAMDVSASTVERDLRFARAWLVEEGERDG